MATTKFNARHGLSVGSTPIDVIDNTGLIATASIPSLDAAKITTGTIDAARLPSYVDDVLEYANLAAFPVSGETGKIYVAQDTNKTYRWSGTVYVYITSGAVDSVGSYTGIVTAANLLDAIKTVDGAGSGLDADLLDGNSSAAFYLATNPSGYTANTGTVTSVASLTLGTTGTDVSSTVANNTTAPVITLNIPTASATNRGALSAVDWTTFNNKQPSGSYLTAESDTLSTVTGRGATTTTASSFTGGLTASGATAITLGHATANVITTNTSAASLSISTLTATAANGDAGAISIISGNGLGAGDSGAITISSGNGGASTNGNSGAVILKTGNATTASGTLTLSTGNGSASSNINISPGTSSFAAIDFSGSVFITGGNSTGNNALVNAGNIVLKGGANTALAGIGGNVIIDGGVGATSKGKILVGNTSDTGEVVIGLSSNITTINGTVKLPNVGTSGFVKLGAGGQLSADTSTYLTTAVTSVSGTGSYGGLTLTGTVTTSGNLTLGGTPTGTWPISISGTPTFAGDAADKADMTTRTDSGFYQSSTGTLAEGWPTNSVGWHHLIACTHNNDSNYYSLQLSSTFFDQELYFRATNGSGTTAWSKLLHSGNYNTYSPTLTGTGASGNWNINVTGTAASITGTYGGTLTSSQITTGLGFTPYNATNPSGYTTNTGTVTSITAGTGLSGGTITGSGTIAIDSSVATLTGSQTFTNKIIDYANNTLTGVQPALVSGTNIKTINGSSVLGSGDIVISNGGGSGTVTSIIAGTGLSGGTITTTGTIAIDSTVTTLTGTQTLTNKTLTDPMISGAILESVFTITDGASVDLNPSNGTIQLWTLGANRTPTASNFLAGESITLMINDGTAYTITWTTAGIIWVNGSAPSLTLTGYTVIELWKVGSSLYGALVGVTS